MALERLDSYRKFELAGDFTRGLVYYAGDYLGRTQTWEVEMLAAELGAEPLDADVLDAADTKATAIYTAWAAAIDAETVTETAVDGVASVVIA